MTAELAPEARKGTLSHIRVLDLSRVLAGPWATQNLADMGAEVIKIERPGAGDDTRSWGPPYLKDPEGKSQDASYFISANRGKQSVTLDIATKEGQRIVRKLAETCDVFIENYKVGTMARYGLGYEDLQAINPRLVYCSLTGFGQSGPYAHLPGYDFVFQGMGGLMSFTGFPDKGTLDSGPVKTGIAIADLIAGMYSALAIVSALEHRNKSNRGQYIDVALLDCLVATTSYQAMSQFYSGRVPAPIGNSHPNMVPYQVFPCKDDNKIILAIGNDSQYASFCRAIGRLDLCEDERFKTVSDRARNRDVLVPIVAEVMKLRTMQEWMDLLNTVNVPCGPIYNLQQVFEDPQVQHRNLKITLKHSSGSDAPQIANPMRFSDTPVCYRTAAPMLGEHTDAVLGRVGLTRSEIDALRDKGVV
jgi:crotonobetainyl-CoA:carnitine CoA-transferase CaiB-like acyl-CoA transferase